MREPRINMAVAAGLFGLQGGCDVAAAFALALVSHNRAPWTPPTGRALEASQKAARRYHISEDLAIFLPAERRGPIGWMQRDEYRALVLSLKRMDTLEGAEREKAIADTKLLLGIG